MTKTLLLLFILPITSASFAQLNKGQWLIGGDGSFSSNRTHLSFPTAGVEYARFRNIQISADAGYFFFRGFAGGVRGNWAFSKQKIYNTSTSSSLQVAPFVRYYVLPGLPKLNFFADASYFWGSNQNKNVSPTQTIKYKSSTDGYTLKAGPAFFISPSASVELTAGYMSYRNGDKLFQLGAGFKIHLGKK